MDRFGNLFLRVTTVVYLVSDNPTRSVLPMAEKLDAELKKSRNQKSK